jgi:hypothetical protein
MISSEVEVTLLIIALYASTCVTFVYANEGVLQRVFRGVRLRVADDRVRIAGRSPVWLNPFTPMFPAFRGKWGQVEAIAAAPGLATRVPEVMDASAVLAPYVFAVFLYAVVGIPVALLLVGAAKALPIVGLAYLAAMVLVVRLWFLRDRFGLDDRKFALLAFESVVCLPFAAGVVRRLSLMLPLTEDLASFVVEMPVAKRAQAVEVLAARCGELATFHAEGSPEADRLACYLAYLSMLAGDVVDATAVGRNGNPAGKAEMP